MDDAPLLTSMVASPVSRTVSIPRSSSYPTRLNSLRSDSIDFHKNGAGDAVSLLGGYNPDLHPLYKRPSRSLTDFYTPDALLASTITESDIPETPFFSSIRNTLRNPWKIDLSKYMRSGSIRGSIFNLCSATLGAGALSIPSAFSDSGIVLGFLLLLIGAWATVFSIKLLVDSRRFTGLQSLEEISVVCYGTKFGFFVEANILIMCFGTLVAYIVAVGDLITPILALTPLNDMVPQEYIREISMSAFWLLIMAPLSVLERINSLRFTSFLGVVAIFFLAFVTAYTSISDLEMSNFNATWGRASLITDKWYNVIQAVPIIMFAFTCQINVIPIYNELENHGTRRFNKVSFRSVSISFTVYLIMGMFGYLNFPCNTQPNILSNYDVARTKDALHLAAYGAILATIALAFPLSVFPLRYTMDVVLFRSKQNSSYATVRKQIIAFIVSGLSLLVALKTPSITFVYSLVGSTVSVFCNFLLPAMLTLKLKRNRPGFHTFLIYTLFYVTLLCGIVSTFGTFYFQFFADPILQGVESPNSC